MITSKLFIDHRDDCYGIQEVQRGNWPHPWACPEYHFLSRTKAGKRHNKAVTGWLIFKCNDTRCAAQLGFLMEDVERLLGLRKEANDDIPIGK